MYVWNGIGRCLIDWIIPCSLFLKCYIHVLNPELICNEIVHCRESFIYWTLNLIINSHKELKLFIMDHNYNQRHGFMEQLGDKYLTTKNNLWNKN